jgi:hypothetical protein
MSTVWISFKRIMSVRLNKLLAILVAVSLLGAYVLPSQYGAFGAEEEAGEAAQVVEAQPEPEPEPEVPVSEEPSDPAPAAPSQEGGTPDGGTSDGGTTEGSAKVSVNYFLVDENGTAGTEPADTATFDAAVGATVAATDFIKEIDGFSYAYAEPESAEVAEGGASFNLFYESGGSLMSMGGELEALAEEDFEFPNDKKDWNAAIKRPGFWIAGKGAMPGASNLEFSQPSINGQMTLDYAFLHLDENGTVTLQFFVNTLRIRRSLI